MTRRVLVVDDEKNIRSTLGLCLESLDCAVSAVATPEAALTALSRAPHQMAFVDLRLAEASGLDLVPRLLAEVPDLTVIVITAYATVDSAVEAMKRGARDYLPKPFTPAQIRILVEQDDERRALRTRLTDLESQLRAAVPEATLETSSPRMQQALERLFRAAGSDASVLLRAESGTGKTVLARALHARSPRAGGPFVVVSGPAVPDELLASTLFGHARGAFTGAIRDQPGKVEAADGGTLFLDEIGEMSASVQAQLLRFLQDREFERLGENRTRRADVRVVAATHRDLEAEVKAGRFREDLFFRINVVEVALPPLRERPEDILPLARRFAAFFAAAVRRGVPDFSPAAQAALAAYAWPGNLRELRNAVEHAVILWPAAVIEPEAFPARVGGPRGAAAPLLGADVTLEELEKEHVARVLARAASLDDAARILGIDASTLWRKRKRYGL